MLHTCK